MGEARSRCSGVSSRVMTAMPAMSWSASVGWEGTVGPELQAMATSATATRSARGERRMLTPRRRYSREPGSRRACAYPTSGSGAEASRSATTSGEAARAPDSTRVAESIAVAVAPDSPGSPTRLMVKLICGGIVAVTVISAMRYADSFVRSAAFARSWSAVALMTTSARSPGSMRSMAVTSVWRAFPAASRAFSAAPGASARAFSATSRAVSPAAWRACSAACLALSRKDITPPQLAALLGGMGRHPSTARGVNVVPPWHRVGPRAPSRPPTSPSVTSRRGGHAPEAWFRAQGPLATAHEPHRHILARPPFPRGMVSGPRPPAAGARHQPRAPRAGGLIAVSAPVHGQQQPVADGQDRGGEGRVGQDGRVEDAQRRRVRGHAAGRAGPGRQPAPQDVVGDDERAGDQPRPEGGQVPEVLGLERVDEGEVEGALERRLPVGEGLERGPADHDDALVGHAGLPPPAPREVRPRAVRVDGHDPPVGRLAQRHPERGVTVRGADLDDGPPARGQDGQHAPAGAVDDGHVLGLRGGLDRRQRGMDRGADALDVIEVDGAGDIAGGLHQWRPSQRARLGPLGGFPVRSAFASRRPKARWV